MVTGKKTIDPIVTVKMLDKLHAEDRRSKRVSRTWRPLSLRTQKQLKSYSQLSYQQIVKHTKLMRRLT